MPAFPGPVSREQLSRLAGMWKQGEHMVVTGPTGGGKTTLARYLGGLRADRRGGTHMVFVCKLKEDRTLAKEYKGYRRWTDFKKSPPPSDRKVLLWPDTDKYEKLRDKVSLQKEVFARALDGLTNVGRWTVQNDEGYYFTHPSGLNLGNEWAIMHSMGRSSYLTLMTLAQRPAHLPLLCYSSASHAFIGRSREQSDLKRLSEMGSKLSAKETAAMISENTLHSFLWVPIASDGEAERFDLKE